MLQLQNLNNVGRKNAFTTVMRDFEMVTSELLKTAVQVFKESIAFVLPEKVPTVRGLGSCWLTWEIGVGIVARKFSCLFARKLSCFL